MRLPVTQADSTADWLVARATMLALAPATAVTAGASAVAEVGKFDKIRGGTVFSKRNGDWSKLNVDFAKLGSNYYDYSFSKYRTSVFRGPENGIHRAAHRNT